MQDYGISNAPAMEILLSCTKPLIKGSLEDTNNTVKADTQKPQTLHTDQPYISVQFAGKSQVNNWLNKGFQQTIHQLIYTSK